MEIREFLDIRGSLKLNVSIYMLKSGLELHVCKYNSAKYRFIITKYEQFNDFEILKEELNIEDFTYDLEINVVNLDDKLDRNIDLFINKFTHHNGYLDNINITCISLGSKYDERYNIINIEKHLLSSNLYKKKFPLIVDVYMSNAFLYTIMDDLQSITEEDHPLILDVMGILPYWKDVNHELKKC